MFIKGRKRFADFKDFNAHGYAEQHYGRNEAVIEDQDICKIVSFALGKLDIRARKAADIGCGPNPYPGMLLLPHAQTVDLLDFSPSNREYMQAFFSGALSYNHIQMWRKFEKHMVEGGGDAYVGIFDAIRQAADQRRVQVGHGDVFKLPAETWDLMTAYFLIDSISLYRSDQHDAIASVNRALTEDGVAIFANMLNRANHVGYQVNGGQEFPNISQTVHQLKQAFTDNDMFSVVARVRHDKQTVRDGYDGMAVVFACHKNSARRQQLIDLIPALKELGVSQVV
jgi:SAM-dependent methyltransferase